MAKKLPIKLPTRYEYTGRELSGGQGKVYVCRDTHLDRDVAIKMMQDVVDVARLLDEIKALQKLRSKHVVQIYDVNFGKKHAKGTHLTIIEEYLPGNDLWNLYKDKLSDADLLKVLYQIASGIADIHGADVIHRDIKPNNMKFDSENLIKIFDFGLARFTNITDSTIGFKGTKGFAAPELYGQGKIKFTNKIDVFAFGASVWLLLNGSLPPELKSVPPKVPSSSFAAIRPSLPNSIAMLLDQTLLAAPDDRPSMENIRGALTRHLLRGKHTGILCHQGKTYTFTKPGQSANITVSGLGGLKIIYDGFLFQATDIIGDVYINNISIVDGHVIVGSCVITLGGNAAGASRQFPTFDVSHPEVVL